MEDTNIIDELFERINALETENAILEQKIKALQDEYDKKELAIEDNIDINGLQSLIDKEKIELNSDFINIDINYVPFDNFNEIFIAGDFTNWEKKPMQNVHIYNLGKWKIYNLSKIGKRLSILLLLLLPE